MDTEANKHLVTAYVEAFNRFDMAALRELFAVHEGMNINLEILDIAAEGKNVVVRYRESGRYSGFFRGLVGHDPTDKSYELTAMEWFVVENGKIATRWGARDSAAILRQVTHP